jgi:hypothetical protein
MPDMTLVSGVSHPDRFLLPLLLGLSTLFASPSSAARIEIGGGKIDVVFESNDPDFPRTLALDWIATAACAVTKYYGRYPVDHAVVRVRPVAGDRIGSGKTFGTPNGGVITISVGRSTRAESFHSDWMLAHEMVHLAFPNVAASHHWIEEGLATYVEPIARVEIGNLTASQVWSETMRDLPKGLPESSDRGLDFTPTWGRTYWGGALFCLLADVKIHQQTANAKGLQDALRGILDAGGTISSDWDLERALRVGDDATGGSVLEELYHQMRSRPHPVDLEQLWHELGVERHGASVILRDNAPLAEVRKAIMPE